MTFVRFALVACALVACSRKKEAPPTADTIATVDAGAQVTTSATIAKPAERAEPAPLTDEQREMVLGKMKPDQPAASGWMTSCVRCNYGRQCSLMVWDPHAPNESRDYRATDPACCRSAAFLEEEKACDAVIRGWGGVPSHH